MSWRRIKSVLLYDLGGPSITPEKIWGARPAFVIALLAFAAALIIDQLSLKYPISAPLPSPSPAATRIPVQFGIDTVDLGPKIRLTRFVPTFDIYPHQAVEGVDSRLYVAYYPDRPPGTWGMMGGEPSRVGILDDGRITNVKLPGDDVSAPINPATAYLIGLKDGMPVVQLYRPGQAPFAIITRSGAQALSAQPSGTQTPGPCIGFAGGRVCEATLGYRSVVFFALPGRAPFVVQSATFGVNDSPPQQRGDVRLEGGGPHRFLLVEYHLDDAECLEGYAP